eukprot:879481-Rhodomonas_salina.2
MSLRSSRPMQRRGRELPALELVGAGHATMSASPSAPGHQKPGGLSSHTPSFIYHCGMHLQSEQDPVCTTVAAALPTARNANLKTPNPSRNWKWYYYRPKSTGW